MDKTIFFVWILFLNFLNPCFSFCGQNGAKKIFDAIGLYEIANIGTFEIVPKLKFVLFPIPDSIWAEYEVKYDSATLSKQFETDFYKFFKEFEIEEYNKLVLEIMKNYQTEEIPRFEYFLNKMDSLRAVIYALDSLFFYFRRNPLENIEQNYINFDSIEKEIFEKLSDGDKNILETRSSEMENFYKYFTDTVLKRTFFYPDISPEIPFLPSDTSLYLDFSNLGKYLKGAKEFLNYITEYSKLLSEYKSKYSELLKEYLNIRLKYAQELKTKGYQSQKELKKKYNKKTKELQNRFERSNKDFQMKLNKFEQKYKNLEKKKNKDLIFRNESNRNQYNYHNLKVLIENHYKFLDKLIALKKQIEVDIIRDLQIRGFINVEVPQN